MTPFHTDGQVTFHHGDAREVLRAMPEASVNCVVTSPPYWSLRDYGVPPSVWGGDAACAHEWQAASSGEGYTGTTRWQHATNGRGEEQPDEKRLRTTTTRTTRPEAWAQVTQGSTCVCGAWCGALGLEPTPELFVAHMVEVFREVRRVLRPDGTLWMNIGDSYAGSWGAQSRGNADNGTSTLEGSNDIARRQIATAARCGSRTGWRGIRTSAPDSKSSSNAGSFVDGPNRYPVDGLKPKDLVGVPWMLAFALRADGWWLRQDIIWSKPNAMPESTKDRCTKAHEYLFLMTKSERYWSDFGAIREPASGWNGSRFDDGKNAEVHPNVGRKRRTVRPGVDTNGGGQGNGEMEYPADSRNKRSVWHIPTSPFLEAHFATFPPALVEPCVLAGCPEGGVVLDPFVGSGTSAMVARQLGRRAVGIDLNPEYLAMAVRRVGSQLAMPSEAAS